MRQIRVWLACGTVLAAMAGPANAGLVIDIHSAGSDLTATTTGSINTTALTQTAAIVGTGQGGLSDFGSDPGSSRGFLMNGGIYNFLSGPTFTGPAYPFTETNLAFSSSSGDLIGLGISGSGVVSVALPSAGYTSGAPISATGTWTSKTFSDLGVNDGDSFIWNWGTGADRDFLRINVGSAASASPVPEPSSLALVGMGAFTMALVLVRRQRARRSGVDDA